MVLLLPLFFGEVDVVRAGAVVGAIIEEEAAVAVVVVVVVAVAVAVG
jgi:hypothetical protein